MRAIRCNDNEIHLGAQVNKVTRPFALPLPLEAASIVQRYRREERDAGGDVPDIESDLGSGREKVLLCVARRRTERGKRRGRRRTADQEIMRPAGVLDQGQQTGTPV